MSRRKIAPGILILLCGVILCACASSPPARRTLEPTKPPPAATATQRAAQPTSAPPVEEAAQATAIEPSRVILLPMTGRSEPVSPTPEPTLTATTRPTRAPTRTPAIPAEDWKDWPVMPGLPDHLREVYQRGLELGNNPYAFSILGDCQSQPEVFMGLYDSDPDAIARLPFQLQETTAHFSGSFDRYSPTVKDGTTEGALLWAQWNDNKEKKCEPGESPLDCELRVHRPSIVFVHVGTHYEARNQRYLTIIIERLLEQGVVPIMVTKADNTELDERINQTIVLMAAEYDLPLWNFWASVQHLPEGGMQPGSNKYLNDEALVIHQQDALQALDIVWRGLQ